MPTDESAFLIRGDDGVEYGPVPLGELREWVIENRAGLGTDVRRDDPGETWRSWHEYPELVALLAEVQGTAAVPGQPAMVLASYWKRAAAFAVDYLLASILATPLFIIAAAYFIPDWFAQYLAAAYQFSSSGAQAFTPPDFSIESRVVINAVSAVTMVLYFTCFQAAHGKTPAKAIFRLRVVDESGRKPTPFKMLLRGLGLVVSMTLFFIPFLYIFFNPQRRALHDLLVGTYVVESK